MKCLGLSGAALAALVLFVLPHQGPAQQAGDSQVRIEFTAIAGDGSQINRMFFRNAEGRPEQLRFRGHSRSLVYEYSGPRRVGFFDYSGTPGEDDFEVIPLGVAEVPQGARHVLCFFFRNTSGEGLPYRVVALDDSEARFPPQSAVIFNASGRNLSLRQGNRNIAIGGGALSPIRLSSGRGAFQFYYESGGNQFLAYNETLYCAPNERIIVIILPPVIPRSSEVRVRIVRQLLDIEVE